MNRSCAPTGYFGSVIGRQTLAARQPWCNFRPSKRALCNAGDGPPINMQGGFVGAIISLRGLAEYRRGSGGT